VFVYPPAAFRIKGHGRSEIEVPLNVSFQAAEIGVDTEIGRAHV
jgi:hypothetical protein